VTARLPTAAALAIGLVAMIAATWLGSTAGLLDGFVRPPAIIRAALVGGSVAVAVVLLSRSLTRMAEGTADIPGLIRGVRLAFLAVAALAAAAGWALANPLPLLVALVIAGVDVVETSFLLILAGTTRG
jgi:hypothetical protein